MYHHRTTFTLILLLSMLLPGIGLVAAGCSAATRSGPEPNFEIADASAQPTDTPESNEVDEQFEVLGPAETVELFYRWYIDYVGDDMLRIENNPLIDSVYRDSDYLSRRFIQEVDEYVSTHNPHGYDPIVMAIQIPDQVEVGEAVVEGTTANVAMTRTWPGLDSWLPMNVSLLQEDGRWLIDDVSLIMSDIATTVGDTPAAAVEAFYTWYLAYGGSPAAGEFRNPLSDRAYAESPYLTADMIAATDARLALTRELELSGADPFLCAQNVPLSVVIERGHMQPVGDAGDGQAQVLLHSGFMGSHYLLLTLQQVGEQWQIDEVNCASASPAGVTAAFYSWYLGQIGERTGADFHNPLVERRYQDTKFLTESLVQRVDETIAGFDQGGFDPFLRAQDIPQGFQVMPGPGEDEAIVDFYFVGPDDAPCGEWRVLVSLVEGEMKGQWFIDEIQSENLPELALFSSPTNGFSFAYPADWVVAELDFNGPGLPDDWPVQEGWQMMPAEIMQQLQARTVPDPTGPPIVAPFQLEVVTGDSAAVSRAFLPLGEAEIGSFGRNLAYVARLEPGYSHLILPHPSQPEKWIVITDWVTGFRGREAQGAAAIPARELLANTLQFHQ